MHEPRKVKEVMENKIGITIYSWTMWQNLTVLVYTFFEHSAAKKAKNMRKCLFTFQIESKYKVQRALNRKNDVSNWG